MTGVAAPVVVIGGGVVGLACARALAQAGRPVLLLEREAKPGRGTSSRSSGVIHAGIYYQTGSLKAALCVEGRERLYAYAAGRGIPHRRCGKLIVATAPSELPALEALRLRAAANGVELAALGAEQVGELAPGVTAVAALLSPDTGIVDAHAYMDALAADAQRAGADIACHARVVAAELVGEVWRLTVGRAADGTERLDAARVVNAAGLYADEIARLVLPAKAASELVLDWVKGNYFGIRPRARAHVDCLVYPCPLPEAHTLGVHLTLDLDGAQRLGPDVQPLTARFEDYRVDPERGPAFLEAARRYLPHLTAADLSPGYAGIRPVRRLPGYGDFYVAEESAHGAPGWVDLVGIDSPGLTAALALAERVVTLVD